MCGPGLANPPNLRKVLIYNQNDRKPQRSGLAEKVAAVTGLKVTHLPTHARKRSENDLIVR